MRKREVKIFPTGILGICFVLAGCNLSAPTYGTNKPVSIQFFEDVANIASLTPVNNSSQIVMKPRPELVIPSPSARRFLPVPQQDRSVNRGAASKQHQGSHSFPHKGSSVNGFSNAKQRQEYLRRQRAQIGSPKYRRYLTEPPLSYRQPAKTAPITR
ncbi:hypothetical protein MNL13_00710 [Bartonella krasnovii]|uniref:Lipoprotein n=1 Tax=Bartonella krasnovii TaxID=2267275 RepID=A0ABY3VVD2_9HYPH|nr:hypothetical protein [Bartonella krasnovii]UNF29341.1 hypothetical protein MNL13_00710 [Bartonella krasnovii]UNF35698.1 hypothetical protein MNL12_00710 [Bartonella krasnovii]UNF37319.1 hypothetical protein MNL11_00725 [Bartonella krasnovii]UNF40743.1 hypothetical protein MNL09_00710 [Bartonella krasnovii]UNF42401.1 hypothetical protein MNL08_00695 [Bartonella krasnovii]